MNHLSTLFVGNHVTDSISSAETPPAHDEFGGTNRWWDWGRRHQSGHGTCAGCWRAGSVVG